MKNLTMVFVTIFSFTSFAQTLTCSEHYYQGTLHQNQSEKSFKVGGEAYASIHPHDTRVDACEKIYTAHLKSRRAVSEVRNALSYFTEANSCGHPGATKKIQQAKTQASYYQTHAEKYLEVYRQTCESKSEETWVCESWGTFNHATGRGITRGQASSTALFFCGEASCRITGCYKL